MKAIPKKALFLDRDGIINIDHGYVHTIEKFEFNSGIFELISLFQKAGYLIFIVTNQSGIGRGYYSLEAFNTLTDWMKEQFITHNIFIESVFHCPHTPTQDCYCRKPKVGMIQPLLEKNSLDLEHSWMIGDKVSDIEFAHNAKIGHTIAIATQKLENAEYFFSSIEACKCYLEENPDKITL